jgi:hypothetical protein
MHECADEAKGKRQPEQAIYSTVLRVRKNLGFV